MFIYTYKLKVSGAHAPLGPTVDTPLNTVDGHGLSNEAHHELLPKKTKIMQD